MGMGLAVQIGAPSEIPPSPKGTQFCGQIGKAMGSGILPKR